MNAKISMFAIVLKRSLMYNLLLYGLYYSRTRSGLDMKLESVAKNTMNKKVR